MSADEQPKAGWCLVTRWSTAQTRSFDALQFDPLANKHNRIHQATAYLHFFTVSEVAHVMKADSIA